MFWKYNNTPSAFDAILKEDVTLKEVMDEEGIINECKGQNKALIDFLLKPNVMEELITLTCVEPSPDVDENIRFKYSNIACELLTCDVPMLNERLAADETLLAKLYSFLDNEPPLNPLLASFFSKIMGALIAKKTEQVLEFLKAKDNFISLLLKHIGTSAIMDLTLKLMTQVEGSEMRQNVLNWLDSQRIIQSLISLLDPKIDKERHYNVAQLLCDFIRTARDTQRNTVERTDPDPLLNTIESPETVSLLLDHIFGEDKSESAIVGGIQVLLTLLDINKSCIPKYDSQNIYNSSGYDETNDLEQRQKVIQSTTKAIQKRLKDFHNLLQDPPKKSPIETTIGILDPPVGNTRLQVTKLIASLILSNNADLVQELISLGTLQVLLDLFFKFQWNNFLHTQVEVCITSALKAVIPQENGDSNALCKHLLVNCKLVERVLGAWEENEDQQTQSKGVRKGYMGHLINIVNQLVTLCSTTSLGQFLKDNLPEMSEALEKFKESTLQDINKKQETLLGGAHPNTSSNEDSDEYGDIPFPQSVLLQQQMFAQYQMQQLTPPTVDSYGFNDDDFNDGDETLQTIDHRTNVTFDLSEGDMVQQHELFKQMCATNINTLEDSDDQIFEDRDHTYQTVIEKQGERREAVYSSDSDEDSPPPLEDPVMDIDPWSSPSGQPPPVSAADPWGSSEKPADNSTAGWADFSSASFGDFQPKFSDIEETKTTNEQQTGDANKEDASITGVAQDKQAVVVSETKDIKIENAEDEKKVNCESVKETIAVTEASIEEKTSQQTGSNVSTVNPEPDKKNV